MLPLQDLAHEGPSYSVDCHSQRRRAVRYRPLRNATSCWQRRQRQKSYCFADRTQSRAKLVSRRRISRNIFFGQHGFGNGARWRTFWRAWHQNTIIPLAKSVLFYFEFCELWVVPQMIHPGLCLENQTLVKALEARRNLSLVRYGYNSSLLCSKRAGLLCLK